MVAQPTMALSQIVDRVEDVDWSSQGAAGREVTLRDIQIDSREVTDGTLFVALPGERTDGHAYIDEAVAAGAAAVLAQRGRMEPATVDVPVVTCTDTRRSLGRVASVFFGKPSEFLTLIGVTGTNGKTTTTHLIADVLDESMAVGLIGTIGARWGEEQLELPNTTPESLTLQRLFWRMSNDGAEVVVLEVSSHALETHRLRETALDVGVFTNFSQDHLDFHGSLSSYREAKARLFDDHLTGRTGTRGPPTAIFNVGDETGRAFAERFQDRAFDVVTYAALDEESGAACSADLEVRDVVETRDGVSFRVSRNGQNFRARTPLLGAFNAENATAAAAVGAELSVEWSEIVERLSTATAVPGRMERVTIPGADSTEAPAVFVDYAHTPDALERAIETVHRVTDGRVWVVFGCGGDRDRDKRAPMGRVATERADRIVVTSDNPRSESPTAIIEDILEGVGSGSDFQAIEDRTEAIRTAIETARPPDTVLVAGKGHETYQEIGSERRKFDDRAVARAALKRRVAESPTNRRRTT